MLKKLKRVTLGSLKTVGAYTLVQKSRWRQGRLLILGYHGLSLADEHEWNPELFMRPDGFYARLQLLKKLRCNVLPLGEALERMYANNLPENCVVLTFDDGHYSFYQHALPMLKAFNFPATLYLTTFYVNNSRPVANSMYSYLLWKGREGTLDLLTIIGQEGRFKLSNGPARVTANNRLREFSRQNNLSAEEQDVLAAKLARQLKIDYEALCAKRMLHLLSSTEVQQLAAEGTDIQLHTHRHRAPLNRALFYREVEENRARIQTLTGVSASHFCYPDGFYCEAFLAWLEQVNVLSATTCEPGFATRQTHRLLLPRLIDHSLLSLLEFEGWLTGVAASLPRRRTTYNAPFRISRWRGTKSREI